MYRAADNVNPAPAMIEHPPDYRVGYRKPPLHTRFKKGQSGNPLGGRLHRRRETRLAALLEAALDTRMARSRRPVTRREAIVTALVEKSAAGDLRAVKLLLELEKTGVDSEAVDAEDGMEAREFLIAELDRLAAEQLAEDAAAQRTRDESVCG